MNGYRVEDLPDRIAAKIRVNSDASCWEWVGALDQNGYGRVRWNGKSWRMVHRVVYVLLVGEIPLDQLDHVKARGCASKACCWPAHLEPVTPSENNRRRPNGNSLKTHCPAGHPYDEENTGRNVQSRGRGHGRSCKACKRERDRARKIRLAQAAAGVRQS